MNIGRENEMKRKLVEEICAIDFPQEAQERVLDGVHQQIRKRRTGMRKGKNYTRVVLAAALVIIGTVTAIGAGKVAYYSSHSYVTDEIYDFDELTRQAKDQLGETVYFPENPLEGISFSNGQVIQVEAKDENHNMVGMFPEAKIDYTTAEGKRICLAISKPIETAVEKKRVDWEETYQDICISGTIDQYLFLPPDQQPSAEDQQLQEEGKLFISYGSSEVERQSFKNVSWDDGELHYLLHTFDDVEVSELMELAKKMIDYGRE